MCRNFQKSAESLFWWISEKIGTFWHVSAHLEHFKFSQFCPTRVRVCAKIESSLGGSVSEMRNVIGVILSSFVARWQRLTIIESFPARRKVFRCRRKVFSKHKHWKYTFSGNEQQWAVMSSNVPKILFIVNCETVCFQWWYFYWKSSLELWERGILAKHDFSPFLLFQQS